MIHLFAPRFRSIIETELPDVVAEAEALGALHYNPMRLVPDEMIGGYRPTDDNFEMLTARRPVMETALDRACARTTGLEVRRGVAVASLVTEGEIASGVPHVVGVQTDGGEELRADLVVDASGRRSPLPADARRGRRARARRGARGLGFHVLRASFPFRRRRDSRRSSAAS